MPDKAKRVARNCDGDGEAPFYSWMPELDQCPRSLIDNDTWLRIEEYEAWKALGILPYGSGSLNDEPAFVAEAFLLCESVLSSIKRELAEESWQKPVSSLP